jgi:hypothetical protein
LLAHGFTVDMLAHLVHDGVATAHRQTMRVGRRKVQFARMMIKRKPSPRLPDAR